jgi:hypothetical protein
MHPVEIQISSDAEDINEEELEDHAVRVGL